MAEPNRRHILELVAGDEVTAGEIADHFNVTRPAISQHLSVLKQAGLLTERRQGTRRLYRARRQGFAATRLFIEGFWDERLGRLKQVAESPTGPDVESELVCVERKVLIAASPLTVWGLLTDPAQAISWMGRTASFDVAPGGSYRVEVVPGQVASGRYVEVDPPHRLAHTWGWEGESGTVPPGSTVVVFDLVPAAGETLLCLTHRDLPSVKAAGSHSRGWNHYLERLATVASGGTPGPDPWVTDPELLTAELKP